MKWRSEAGSKFKNCPEVKWWNQSSLIISLLLINEIYLNLKIANESKKNFIWVCELHRSQGMKLNATSKITPESKNGVWAKHENSFDVNTEGGVEIKLKNYFKVKSWSLCKIWECIQNKYCWCSREVWKLLQSQELGRASRHENNDKFEIRYGIKRWSRI